MTSSQDRRATAHDSLCLTEAPYVKHYPRGRFALWHGVAFTASALPGPGFNFAAVLTPETPRLDDLVPIAREFFADCDSGWGILVEGDADHPMEAELRAGGWAVDEDEPAFVRDDLSDLGHSRVRSSLAIRRVSDPEGADAFHDLVGRAFGAPPEMMIAMRPLPTMAEDPNISLFIGSEGGIDVTGAGYSRSGSTAVLWGVATLAEYRGCGRGSEVSRAALAHAAGRGCVNASLRSGPKSIPVYERLGFRYACRHRTYRFPG